MINRLASVLNVAAYVLKKTGDITAMKILKASEHYGFRYIKIPAMVAD